MKKHIKTYGNMWNIYRNMRYVHIEHVKHKGVS